MRCALVLVLVLGLAGCGDGGPSCAERGGHIVNDPPIYVSMANGILYPIEQSHCEVPR